MPTAARAFSDTEGNSMVLWAGSTPGLNRPLLVAEGIDAENINSPNSYYGIGSTLFGLGRERGADVLILDFADGGRDLEDNADVVQGAIQFVNQLKTGTRPLDVAGVSMGGVVSRFALADMEQRGITHDVGHFVSIDAPQQGAVLDEELLDWMYDPPWWADGNFDAPAAVTSTAGKQLLQENPFDTTSPSLHDRFYDRLDALNGDGYPHLPENIGVSFGTPVPNQEVGQEWLEIEADGVTNPTFDIEQGSPEAVAGSLLPRDITNLGGVALVELPYIGIHFTVEAAYNLDRKANPTFIPYDSALDRVNGQSKFDVELSAEDRAYAHNVIPPEVIEPLLERLGYPAPPPPPVVADIDGPWALAISELGMWSGEASGGVPGYTYKWAYRRLPEDPSACDAPPPDPDPPPCNPDKFGNCTMSGGGTVIPMGLPVCEEFGPDVLGRTFSKAFNPAGLYQLRLTVSDSGGDNDVDYWTIEVGGGGFTRGGSPSTTATGGETTASARAETRGEVTGAPEAVALEAYPNPVSSASTTTTVRFGLPAAADVALVVYDVLGREVARLAEGERAAGWHAARFDASALPSGRYVVRLTAGTHAETLSVTVLR